MESDNDDDDGDKSCDFDAKFSGDEGLGSGDENRVHESDEFGEDSEPMASEDNQSELSENAVKMQTAMRDILKNQMNKIGSGDEDAGDKESDDDESLASEFESDEDIKAKVGQKRSFQQAQGQYGNQASSVLAKFD